MTTPTDDPMPVFVLKAKDRLAGPAVTAYFHSCLNAGLDGQAAEVSKAIDEFRGWQHRHPDAIKLPDHEHVPASKGAAGIGDTRLAGAVALKEARDLARIMWNVLQQMPTCTGDFDPRLDYERVPEWIHGAGEADSVLDNVETRTEWVAWYGGPDPDNCAGTLVYDDMDEAVEMTEYLADSGVAYREVVEGPWVVVPDQPAEQATEVSA